MVQTIYVDFDDAPGDPREIPGIEETFDVSVKALGEASGGALTLQRQSHPVWTRLAGTSAEWEDSGRDLAIAVAGADDVVDFSNVDVVWVVWMTATPRDAFRSHAGSDYQVVADGRTLTHGSLMRQIDLSRGGHWVPTHEMGHVLGLPDLYDTSNDGGPTTRWTGPWDLMASTSGPGHAYFAWHRWMLGWASDAQVACVLPGQERTVSLSPVQSDGPTLLAAVRLDASRVLTVESRRAQKWDIGIPREGVLVSTVDVTRTTGDGPIQVGFADGRHPDVRDETTLSDAPLRAGETYTDAATGVSVHVDSTGGDVDVVRLDASSIAPRPISAKKTIALYRTTQDGTRVVSLDDLVTRDTGVDAVAFGTFDVREDGAFVRNGELFFADTDPGARAELARVRADGIPVVATLGGESASIWSLLSRDFDRYYANLRSYLLTNRFDAVELDIRSPLDTGTVVKLIDALRRDLGPLSTVSLVGDAAAFAGGSDAAPDYPAVAAARGEDVEWFALRLSCDAVPTGAEYRQLVAQLGMPPERVVLSATTSPALCPAGAAFTAPDEFARSLQDIVAAEPRFGGIRGDEYANAVPGGAAAPWQWFATMTAAMNDPAPLPTVSPESTASPDPTVSPKPTASPVPTASDGPSALAQSGTGEWLGLVPLAGILIVAGVLLAGRRRRTTV
ncbi:immune inhibitor A domain-containing protein [Microbacterium testaceum]|uniref:immune inhibitor A domain-containing protein n=1 Tax=Microbacterium testaceum TaxID=2033 RepID=UPI0002EFA036|nr:immune inhibitor A domain-containing protein [Microbacterium testaceum]